MSNLPFLPGHRFTDPYKQNFHKDQLLVLNSNTCREKPIINEKIDPEQISNLSKFTSLWTDDRLKARTTSLNESYPRILPQWIKHDKKVLKFSCYFLEHVVESAHENFRVRRCDLFYYLDDDTIHINELKVENSGIPQGYFLKRARIKKNENEYYHWKDINLQSEMSFYGKCIRICDCDEFTKRFYAEMGQSLNPPTKVPDLEEEEKIKYDQVKDKFQTGNEMKEYIEVKLGGGHPNRTLKTFLENDRKVLNFDISWNDDKYDKEEKIYIMNYFLSDGKIEIREIKESNSGKDPFPLLLKKSKLPVVPIFSYCPGLDTKKEEHYTPKDLIIGNTINIYGRPCLIYGCDEFTRRWYKENFGVDMVNITKYRKLQSRIIHPIPAHTSKMGSEEDSLLSVFHLRPTAKIVGLNKMFKSDKHILRFNSKLISPIASDSERKFIFSYYCRDDTIQVYEIAEKNSGRQACKFMERQKHRNPYNGKYYKEKDLMVGNTVYLNKYTFKLLEADAYTEKYMRDNPEVFIDSDLVAVIDRIRSVSSKFNSLDEFGVSLLKALDPKANNFVGKNDILNGLKEFNIFLSSQEILILLESLSINESGLYSMEDLYNLVLKSY